MKMNPVFRQLAVGICIILLLIISWISITGGLDQLPRSETTGQKAETFVQLICGILSLVSILTLYLWKKWAQIIQYAWAVSFVITAGLSALVWGPPMWAIALIFGVAALLLATGILKILRITFDTKK